MKPTVEFKNVHRDYVMTAGVVRAVDGITFKINPGEFVAITGPSGSGKSTLLHLIGLLDQPTAGSVFIDGTDASRISDNDLARLRNKKIGFVFQQFNLLRRTPAIGNVELPLIYAGVNSHLRYLKARAVLEKVGLGEKLASRPSQLSGGQQQRVAIARALVTEPALLLADEPTGNLDSKSGEEILKLFESLHKEGSTIVLVTHDMNVAGRAKRQIMIRDGKIIKDK